MTLKPIEWADAQELLTGLVQALSPLTVREISPSLFLTRRFLIPQEKDLSSVGRSHQVKLLSALHALQQEVGEWVEEAPEHPKSERPRSRDMNLPAKNQETSKGETPNLERQALSKESVPVTRQAQELIHQVQGAIAKLCRSAQMQSPQEEVLLRVLHELKPKLDRIVETLASGEVSTLRPYIKAVPISKRQEQFSQKMVPANKTDRKEPSSEPLPLKGVEKKTPENQSSSLVATVLQTAENTEMRPQLDLRFVTLPGAPHTPEPKRLILNNKRKKRKGLWFREDQDSRRDP